MSFKVLDTKIVWGSNFPDAMNGMVSMKKDGWKPLGSPTPLILEGVYGMMHMIYRDRSKE